MANTSMQNMQLPEEIQNIIINDMMSTQNNLENQEELKNFYMMLKPSIRSTVTSHIFIKKFKYNSIFRRNIKKIMNLKDRIMPIYFSPEENVIE